MKVKELEALTDDELREVALRKTNKGIATREASMAQRILWIRAGMPFNGSRNDIPEVTWCSIREVRNE